MNLGEEKGHEVFQKLSKIKKNTSVVAMSADFTSDEKNLIKKIGMKETLTKNFNEEVIDQFLEKYLTSDA